MRSRIFTTICSSLILLGVHLTAHADLGRTYRIVEPDAIEEFQRKASGIDWQAKFRAINLREKVRDGSVRLPVAQRDREYRLDLNYTLEFDIPDGKGGVLYPKGYRFNPVAFVKLPYRLAVIGTRPVEMEWAKKQQGPIVWMTSGGDPIDMSKALNQTVYLYTPEMAKRFRVQATPALIRQEGDQLVAQEYQLEEKEQ